MSFLADLVDNVGTAIGAPDLGWSEALNGNKATVNTGRVGFTDTGGLFNSASSPSNSIVTNAYNSRQAQSPGTTGAADTTGAINPTNTATSSTTTATPAAVPDLSSYDAAASTVNGQLARLPGQLDIAKGNIQTQFNTNQNELDSAKAQAQNSYNNSTTQNGQSLRTNKNTIADQASAGLRGLLRTLGAYGAGGSSDALYNAPGAVATQASAQRSGAGQTFAQNQQNLDTNWGNFQTGDKTSRQKLSDWLSQQTNSAQSQSDTAKQGLLSSLANILGQRSAAAGGSFAASAQPYLDQANALGSQIDQLGALNPTYTGTTPVYSAPTLDSYNAGNGTATSVNPTAASNPYLALLLGQNKDKTTLGA